MLILTIRTDKPEAEIGIYQDGQQLAYRGWQAHRQLAETIHTTIQQELEKQSKALHDVQAIVVYQGPGSFTGLRIGCSVANALAASLNVPIVAQMNDNWLSEGIARIVQGENDEVCLPEYGAPVHITQPKK